MPKQSKSVQMRHKVSKYVANVWQWRTPAGDRSAQQGVWLWYIQSKKALALGCGRRRQISMTPSFESKRGVQFEVPLRAGQDGLSYLWPQTDIHKTVHKFYISFKGRKSAGDVCCSGRFPWHPSRCTPQILVYSSCFFSPTLILRVDESGLRRSLLRWWNRHTRPCTKQYAPVTT